MAIESEFNMMPSRSKVYAVTSGKGGVGKTFISVNLAIILSKAGARVLLIDADLGLANVDLMTGISAPHSVEEVINGEASIFDALAEGPGGLTILSASSGLGSIQDMGQERLAMFRKELLKLENAFDLIFIDTGAGISANVVDFVFMADEVLVVMTPEPTAFADAYAMVKLVSIQKPEIDIGVIVNIVKNEDEARHFYSKFSEIVKRFLGRSIYFRGAIVRDNAVPEAVIRQTPLVLFPGTPPSIKSIRRIARSLAGAKKANKRSLFNR